MGAGEPFLNFENLITALRIMADEDGLFIVPDAEVEGAKGAGVEVRGVATLKDAIAVLSAKT